MCEVRGGTRTARITHLVYGSDPVIVSKAKEQLSRLIDKVLAGEEVTNTRHGKPVVDLRPRSATGRGRPPGALIDEIAARAKLLPPLKKRAAEIVREMREEER
jgi:antitoxin (DNA-binding transcriptional repressor) of toxin-antitoxin stability system